MYIHGIRIQVRKNILYRLRIDSIVCANKDSQKVLCNRKMDRPDKHLSKKIGIRRSHTWEIPLAVQTYPPIGSWRDEGSCHSLPSMDKEKIWENDKSKAKQKNKNKQTNKCNCRSRFHSRIRWTTTWIIIVMKTRTPSPLSSFLFLFLNVLRPNWNLLYVTNPEMA